jgi:hypothetical protein
VPQESHFVQKLQQLGIGLLNLVVLALLPTCPLIVVVVIVVFRKQIIALLNLNLL